MKKSTLFSLLALTLFLTTISCKKDRSSHKESLANCYRGRLEIKGWCGNYTIKVLDSTTPPGMVQDTWTNPYTSNIYQNVFGLSNICDFPNTLKQGDEFYFSITKGSKNNCAYCTGYYPAPDTTQDIVVLSAPCNKTTN